MIAETPGGCRREPEFAIADGGAAASRVDLRASGAEPGKVQLLIHADIGNTFRAARRVSIGYSILDQNGQEVDTRRLDNRLMPVMNGVPSALQFVAGASLLRATTLKLAAADGEQVGSVDIAFRRGWPKTVP